MKSIIDAISLAFLVGASTFSVTSCGADIPPPVEEESNTPEEVVVQKDPAEAFVVIKVSAREIERPALFEKFDVCASSQTLFIVCTSYGAISIFVDGCGNIEARPASDHPSEKFCNEF